MGIAVDLIERNRQTHRDRHTRGAAEGAGDRGRRRHRVYGRLILGTDGNGTGGNIGGTVTVDVGINVSADTVFREDAGAADADPGLAAAGDGDGCCDHHGVDGLLGVGRDGQGAGCLDRAVLGIGLDARRHLGKVDLLPDCNIGVVLDPEVDPDFLPIIGEVVGGSKINGGRLIADILVQTTERRAAFKIRRDGDHISILQALHAIVGLEVGLRLDARFP